MKAEECREITTSRLAGWTDRLTEENATPMLLLGVGHGVKAGQLVVCVVEDLTDEQIRASLRFALRQMGG